jgi:hypothetical protein
LRRNKNYNHHSKLHRVMSIRPDSMNPRWTWSLHYRFCQPKSRRPPDQQRPQLWKAASFSLSFPIFFAAETATLSLDSERRMTYPRDQLTKLHSHEIPDGHN